MYLFPPFVWSMSAIAFGLFDSHRCCLDESLSFGLAPIKHERHQRTKATHTADECPVPGASSRNSQVSLATLNDFRKHLHSSESTFTIVHSMVVKS